MGSGRGLEALWSYKQLNVAYCEQIERSSPELGMLICMRSHDYKPFGHDVEKTTTSRGYTKKKNSKWNIDYHTMQLFRFFVFYRRLVASKRIADSQHEVKPLRRIAVILEVAGARDIVDVQECAQIFGVAVFKTQVEIENRIQRF